MGEKYTYTLPIGDWSKDGHNQSDNYVFVINKSKSEIAKAYHESCNLLNMTFDTNDMRERNPIRLINEYEDNVLDTEVCKKLMAHGVNLDVLESFDKEYFEEDTVFIGSEDAAYLFLEFVKISLPDMEYSQSNSNPNYLFGYSGDLNISVGYGCFYN